MAKRNVALAGPDSVPASQEAEVGVLEQKEKPIHLKSRWEKKLFTINFGFPRQALLSLCNPGCPGAWLCR